jgi:hypothetical protein
MDKRVDFPLCRPRADKPTGIKQTPTVRRALTTGKITF